MAKLDKSVLDVLEGEGLPGLAKRFEGKDHEEVDINDNLLKRWIREGKIRLKDGATLPEGLSHLEREFKKQKDGDLDASTGTPESHPVDDGTVVISIDLGKDDEDINEVLRSGLLASIIDAIKNKKTVHIQLEKDGKLVELLDEPLDEYYFEGNSTETEKSIMAYITDRIKEHRGTLESSDRTEDDERSKGGEDMAEAKGLNGEYSGVSYVISGDSLEDCIKKAVEDANNPEFESRVNDTMRQIILKVNSRSIARNLTKEAFKGANLEEKLMALYKDADFTRDIPDGSASSGGDGAHDHAGGGGAHDHAADDGAHDHAGGHGAHDHADDDGTIRVLEDILKRAGFEGVTVETRENSKEGTRLMFMYKGKDLTEYGAIDKLDPMKGQSFFDAIKRACQAVDEELSRDDKKKYLTIGEFCKMVSSWYMNDRENAFDTFKLNGEEIRIADMARDLGAECTEEKLTKVLQEACLSNIEHKHGPVRTPGADAPGKDDSAGSGRGADDSAGSGRGADDSAGSGRGAADPVRTDTPAETGTPAPEPTPATPEQINEMLTTLEAADTEAAKEATKKAIDIVKDGKKKTNPRKAVQQESKRLFDEMLSGKTPAEARKKMETFRGNYEKLVKYIKAKKALEECKISATPSDETLKKAQEAYAVLQSMSAEDLKAIRELRSNVSIITTLDIASRNEPKFAPTFVVPKQNEELEKAQEGYNKNEQVYKARGDTVSAVARKKEEYDKKKAALRDAKQALEDGKAARDKDGTFLDIDSLQQSVREAKDEAKRAKKTLRGAKRDRFKSMHSLRQGNAIHVIQQQIDSSVVYRCIIKPNSSEVQKATDLKYDYESIRDAVSTLGRSFETIRDILNSDVLTQGVADEKKKAIEEERLSLIRALVNGLEDTRRIDPTTHTPPDPSI